MERRAIAIQGTVQGVGFRPFVYGLACDLKLGGFVRNQTGGVTIEVEGDGPSLDQFVSRLIAHPPPLARIETWTCDPQAPRGDQRFRIEPSDRAPLGPIVITPDAATCDACLTELFDPGDRRYRYPFLNCTNCGPRLTIVTGAPYDRAQTTMAGFTMCPLCQAEYEDPANRRFHAQPNACPVCGPRLALLDAQGSRVAAADPLADFVDAIRAGKIGAMKGLGGYHLICDASNSSAVAELRRRKHRDEKPLAIMVRDWAAAEVVCAVDPASHELLTGARRPIVLLRRRDSDLADELAPRNPFLGVMLPYTPLHHLLLHDLDGMPLVMTSGNRSDEPIAYEEPDAMERLRGIADVFLIHDRPIHVRCDDSVTRVMDGVESPIRRSRGYAPQPISLPVNCPEPMLAVGGQLKGAFALGVERRAIVSHHMGDLDHLEASRAFERDIGLYERLFSLRSKYIVHDLHPDYASTRYAMKREAAGQVKCIAVQHHHAHMASCMAEHGLIGPVIGVTLDGTGFGTDGRIWGGEFLVGDYRSFKRAAHLRYVGLPGGEQAVREPWRMAVSHLLDAGIPCAKLDKRLPAASLRTVRQMLERGFNCPLISSAGRLFDAVASLAQVRDRVSYEGQAAMELEWIASTNTPTTDAMQSPHFPIIAEGGSPGPGAQSPGLPPSAIRKTLEERASNCDFHHSYPIDLIEPNPNSDDSAMIIDTRPMIRTIATHVDAGASAAHIARRFHTTWVEIISSVCNRIRTSTQSNIVVFSGGVFMNALLSIETNNRLTREGFRVFQHRTVPPNDGGLSLGQLAIAACQLHPA
jgi:hydrogenase maturation protein HypF